MGGRYDTSEIGPAQALLVELSSAGVIQSASTSRATATGVQGHSDGALTRVPALGDVTEVAEKGLTHRRQKGNQHEGYQPEGMKMSGQCDRGAGARVQVTPGSGSPSPGVQRRWRGRSWPYPRRCPRAPTELGPTGVTGDHGGGESSHHTGDTGFFSTWSCERASGRQLEACPLQEADVPVVFVKNPGEQTQVDPLTPPT